MSERMFRLGFIGLGIMGTPMVQRLLRQGWQVTVWNLEPERFSAVEPLGARWADSPAAVRAASDVVLICVLGDPAIENVCLGANGLAAGSGATRLIDFSTTSPETTLSIAGRLGMDWLDCPMSGGPQAAADGQLTMMAGGDTALFESLHPILADLGSNITLMGGPAAGQLTKIINQAIVGVNYVLMSEVLAMVRAGGIDGSKLASCLRGGAADSRILQTVFPQMLAADFANPRSHAKQMNKDMHSVEHFIADHRLDLPLQAVAVRQFDTYASAGNGEADSASICRLYLKDDER